MRTDEIEATLRRVSYKPGWRFTVDDRMHDDEVTIVLQHDTPDVNDPENIITVTTLTRGLRETYSNEEILLRGVVPKLIRQMEYHEIDEWFKIDGKHVRDPHPEKKA